MSSLSENVTAAEVKALAKRLGADLVGISPMSRWEGAPKQNDPRYIFPGAKSMIVLAFRIPRGLLRGIEEGTRFLDYPGMGYASVRDQFMMGTDLLVAPVVTKGQTERQVVIPPGTWIADDGEEFVGPKTITVKVPLSRLPHFTLKR